MGCELSGGLRAECQLSPLLGLKKREKTWRREWPSRGSRSLNTGPEGPEASVGNRLPLGVVMECTITRQYTFIMAPNTVQELWITMPGRYTHAIHVFTPQRDYIHTS